jgi:hypothetical protein
LNKAAISLVAAAIAGIFGGMADSKEKPVLPLLLPFRNKEGAGWHVVIRYFDHERRVEGFSTEAEAKEWIASRFNQTA